MKRTICLILALVMILSLCACGKEATNGPATDPDTGSSQQPPQNQQQSIQQAEQAIEKTQNEGGVTVDYMLAVDESRKSTANTDEKLESLTIIQKFNLTDVTPLNMHRSEKTIALVGPVYEALFRRTGVDEFVGVLAKEWEWTDEYLDVTIYDYIYDHEGNHITADDVIFSYDTLDASGTAINWSGYVKSWEKTGDYSVRFTFEQPLNSDVFRYCFAINSIYSQKAYEAHEGMVTTACGTGPYKVTDFVASTYVVIEATDNYWQTPELTDEFAQANVQTVRVDIIADAAQQLIALQSGNAAYCALTADTINDFLAGGKYSGEYQLCSHLDADTLGVMANMHEDSVMSDINMRLACFYAIDTAAIVKMLGESMYLTCTVNTSRVPVDYNPEWDTIESYHTVTDYALVNEYLEKAGYNGEPITLLCEEHATKKTIAEAVKNMLEAAGIACNLEVREFALMETEMENPANWDLYMSSDGSSGYTVARIDESYSVLKGLVEGYPENFLQDDEFQAKLAEAVQAAGKDQARSDELIDWIIHYIVDNALEISVCYAQTVTAYEPIFGNLMLRFGENKVMVTACEYYLD